MEKIHQIGEFAVEAVMTLAALLRQDATPGLVAIALIGALCVAILHLAITIQRRRAALSWIRGIVAQATDDEDFSRRISELDRTVALGGRSRQRASVATAWDEYRETLIAQEQDGDIILRNAVRPGSFFNLEDLHFGAGFWRILPSLFVTVGLFLTFLGLISALGTMGEDMDAGGLSTSAMKQLLTVASAKFIMSLTGLFCSIIFTIALRFGMGRIEEAIVSLNRALEKRLSFLSLEDLAVEQLAAVREQREHFRSIGLELVAELGRPLREELPTAISKSIGDAMSPLISQVGQMSSDGVGEMVRDLSTRFSDDVGQALAQASDRLGQAGDRIGLLVDRMEQSSGRMGSEIETAILRLGQAMEELRSTLTASADATSGAFSQGAESILSAMNTTLQSIRDNTGEGARAMSEAAADMRAAAEGIRSELEAAAQSGAAAAQDRMKQASEEASGAIGTAGAGVLAAFDKTSAEMARITDEMASRAGKELVEPMGTIAERIEDMVAALTEGTTQVRRASEGIRAGADASSEAAGTFRGSAQALVAASDPVRATVERLEDTTRQLAASTGHIANSARSQVDSAAQTLAAAQQALGGQQRAIEATLEGLSQSLERMRGQGDRLDDMDEKLGAAFEAYTSQVTVAVEGLFRHVRDMQDKLNPALDTMREIVEQAEEFAPQSRRA